MYSYYLWNMSHPNKPKKYITFQTLLYEDGKTMVKSNLLEPKADTVDTSFIRNQNPINQEEKLYTQESLVKNKTQTCKNNDDCLKKDIPDTKSLLTSEVESILREKDLTPFWTNYSNTISKKLWLPRTTDLVDLGLNSFNQCLPNSMPHSHLLIPNKLNLLNKNYHKTLSPLLQCFPQNTTGSASIIYTRKIRIYPSNEQKKYFNSCFGANRYFFNKTVEFINEAPEKLKIYKQAGCIYRCFEQDQCCNDTKTEKHLYCQEHIKQKSKLGYKLNLQTLRSKIIKKELQNNEKWQKDVPYNTRQLAIKECIGAFKSGLTNLKRGNIDSFELKYKRRKNPRQMFHVDHRSINIERYVFPSKLKTKFRIRNKMKKWWQNNIKEIVHDCIISRDSRKRYYLCLTLEKKQIDLKAENEIVAIDPGVRTCQTLYSPSGECAKIGDNIIDVLFRKAERVDKLKSLITREKKKRTRYNMKKRCSKLITKIKNIVEDLHKKTATYLCKNYQTILLPEFGSKDMTKKLPERARNLNTKSVRNMLSLSHYKFRQILQHKANEYKRSVILCDEAYTSKTCGNCGHIDLKLGSKKVYECKECRVVIDRDINGARNILIKQLTKIRSRYGP